MPIAPPPIDLFPDSSSVPDFTPPVPPSRRPRLFASVFLACLVPSLAYVWLRPPVYESAASLLTVTPAGADQPEIKASVQHLAIQRQRLLGMPLLEETLRRLEADTNPDLAANLGINGLRAMLTVKPVKNTNVVELRAQGPHPGLLAPVVNAWIDAYRALREREVRDNQDLTAQALTEEYAQLGRQIDRKRQALDQFDRAHDILARKNADNEIMAQFKGLNTTLSKANEDAVKAKAKLDAIRAAIARGEPVVPPKDEHSLALLRQRLQALREQAKDAHRRYTAQYLALQPQLKLIPEQLAQTEAAIKSLVDEGQRAALSEAEQDHLAAARSVETLRQQVDTQKREVSEFSARFAEHDALVADVEQLEKLYRKLEARLAQVQAKPLENYPPLQVLEHAYPPAGPSWPHYWRDSGIALGGSLGTALLVLLIYDYLARRETAPPQIRLPDVRVYSVSENLLLQRQQEAAPILAHNAAPLALENLPPRELGEPELRQLLDIADLKGKQLLGLLLSGLTLAEATALQPEAVDLERQRLSAGEPPRQLPLAPRLGHWLSQGEPRPLWAATPDAEELAAHLACLATDAGVPDPATIDAEALRHSYVVYLVRQGLRLAELESIVGPMAAKQRAAYARYSPPGPGLKAEGVPLIYPALRESDLGLG